MSIHFYIPERSSYFVLPKTFTRDKIEPLSHIRIIIQAATLTMIDHHLRCVFAYKGIASNGEVELKVTVYEQTNLFPNIEDDPFNDLFQEINLALEQHNRRGLHTKYTTMEVQFGTPLMYSLLKDRYPKSPSKN